jgi:hypothetical protein
MLTNIAVLLAYALLFDPLAPAWDGLVQCYAPDQRQKTCRALAGYTRMPDGTIVNDAEVVLSFGEPVIIGRFRDPVFVRGDAVCGYAKDDLETIVSVEIDGQLFDDSNDETGIRRAVAEVVRDQIGGEELCTVYEPLGNGDFRPRYYRDGKIFEVEDERVIWVRPEEGWRVAP